ncbi:unnamed protein product [Ixodes pacificus]
MSCECCVLRVFFPSENTRFLFLIVFRTNVNPVLKIWWNAYCFLCFRFITHCTLRNARASKLLSHFRSKRI